MTDDYFLSFADDPLKPRESGHADGSEELVFRDSAYDKDDELSAGYAGKLVLLNNSQKGSLKTCRAETRFADSVTLDQLSRGSRICVLTDSGHVALVTYRGRAPESDPSSYVKLDVKVWRNAIPAEED
ncbi:hypothetical protein ABZ686_27590 [Streptomyces sp. NPDC006992]|uniref:hypothetical protein n=1 Tax=Streptomyces sp. NPDC006992 TaxID=3155601 RepID=UPI0033CB494D